MSICLILFLVAGLNPSSVYPEFSAFAVGIPALTMIGMLLQWSFSPLLIAKKLRDLEYKHGKLIAAGDVERGRKRGKRRRR